MRKPLPQLGNPFEEKIAGVVEVKLAVARGRRRCAEQQTKNPRAHPVMLNTRKLWSR